MDVHASTVSTLHLCCISVDRYVMMMEMVMMRMMMMIKRMMTVKIDESG